MPDDKSVNLGHFREVTAWAIHFTPTSVENGPVAPLPDEPWPKVMALFADDFCHCGQCERMPLDSRPCPQLEVVARTAHRRAQEIRPEVTVELDSITMPAYFTHRGRVHEAVEQLTKRRADGADDL